MAKVELHLSSGCCRREKERARREETVRTVNETTLKEIENERERVLAQDDRE